MTDVSRKDGLRLINRLSKTSLSVRIIIGLAVGIFLGLFFGEPIAMLQPLADTYIRLMQMTVLPYLVLTLILGIGRMEASEAKRLAIRGCLLLVVFWTLALAIVGLMPLAFPDAENASFFSSSLVQPHQPLALHEIYVPSNPFHAMANAVIPAVVLFSSALGVALIGVDNKATLLGSLMVLEQAVIRVTRFVISLTPIGVCAISAVAAGTMDADTIGRLEVYLVCFAVASLLITFVVLPLAVVALTPFSYREVLAVSRDALLTAFIANSAFIVLPILIEQANSLLKKHHLRTPEAASAVEVLVPMAFTFPNPGKLLTLLFVPYAAWMAGSPLSIESYGSLFGAGVFAYFAKAQVALPFLLDLMNIPQDHFQLYIPTTIVTGKFDSMVSAMSLLAFALIGASAMAGFIRFKPSRIIISLLLVTVSTAVSILTTGAALNTVVDTSYRKGDVLRHMHTPRTATPSIIHKNIPVVHGEATLPSLPMLDRIRARGHLRVGYDPANPPFSFFNADDELVGFDVELAQSLVEALGVKLEMVPIRWTELPRMLSDGTIDLMPGVWYRPFWFSSLRLSAPYMTGTVGLIVRDERRSEFESVEAIHHSRGLKIGVPLDSSQLAYSMRQYFGESNTQFETIETPVPFLEGHFPHLDAFLWPAEGASAATLLHPEYSVVVPQPNPVKIPYAFGFGLNSNDLVATVNEWVIFAQSEGTIQRAYDFWILGKGAAPKRRRWSIMNDVLGWGE